MSPSSMWLIRTSAVFTFFIIADAHGGSEDREVSAPQSAAQSLVFGPGLDGRFNLPVRYFYIQAVDINGRNLTSSPGDKSFDVTITRVDGIRQRIWVQVLDRNDGVFIVRFRLYSQSADLSIQVKLRGSHVAKSPYLVKGPLYHEDCYCPTSMEQFLVDLQCPSSYTQIEQDLAIFKSVNMTDISQKMKKRFNNPNSQSICQYAIVDNKLHRNCYGQHVGFKMFADNILLSLMRKVHLPDMELLINLGDWPLELGKKGQHILPIFSWCGSEQSHDIVMPTYDLAEATLQMMGRVSLDMFSVQANKAPRWSQKLNKGFWRGRDSRQERLDLAELSQKHPHLLDAALTNYFFFKEDEKKYGPKAKYVSFFDFFNYRYQVSIDGTVAAYRFPYLLAGDSAILKQDSSYYEHFYNQLQPFEHYIPIVSNISDVLEKLAWAQSHDNHVKKIIKNGQKFARENLLPRDIFCYHLVLFKKWSELLSEAVGISQGMEEVAQPQQDHCQCYHVSKHRDEL